MRYLYAYFKNYIGFYNGCGLREIEIDFTKCKNNIVLICGMNGSGKSTLLNALSPSVDSNSSYVPGAEAEKILKLMDNGDIYLIHIISQIDSKGNRKQAKAFFEKNGIQLNENGNVTSFKDIVFSEFDMDPNYLSLTKLSSTNRGLGDKTPAERKKFAASIVDNLETYNDMYKTLNKKSLIFKSHINTLHTKIQNIGSKDELQIKLDTLRQQNDSISSEIMGLNNRIVELQTITSINQEDSNRLDQLYKEKEEIETNLCILKNQIDLLVNKTHITRDSIEQVYDQDFELSQTYHNKCVTLIADRKAVMDKLSSLSSSIHELEVMIESYSSSIDYELEDRFNTRKNNIENLKNILRDLNIVTDTVYIDDLTSLLEFCRSFIKNIDLFYDGLEISMLSYIALNYDLNKTNNLTKELEEEYNKLERYKENLNRYNNYLSIVSILDKRPKNCKNDTCGFISSALELSKTYGTATDLRNFIYNMEKKIKEISDNIDQLRMNIEISEICDRKRRELDLVIEDIKRIGKIAKFFGESEISDIDLFLKEISNGYQFNNQREPRRLIDGLNYLKMLRSEYTTYSILQEQYKAMQDKLSIISDNEKMIAKKREELEKCQIESDSILSDMNKYSSLLDSLTKKLTLEKEYIDKLNKYTYIKENDLSSIERKIEEIKKKSSNSISVMNQITGMKARIEELTLQSKPIIDNIQRLSGQLTMLDSYYQEHEMYSIKYNMIETLKKYCSPTGGGIQTLFMQLYMSKTLDIANQILQMLFNGEYKLLDFIINQNEFRIPFIGNGLPVDDISSGSCSQIAMMGLAINMALFYQASTKYNIPRFDEIESGLDNYNREKIINIFAYIIKLLNIEQAFIISHSIELDNSLADIIKLKMYDNSDQVFLGNVIYDDSKIK